MERDQREPCALRTDGLRARRAGFDQPGHGRLRRHSPAGEHAPVAPRPLRTALRRGPARNSPARAARRKAARPRGDRGLGPRPIVTGRCEAPRRSTAAARARGAVDRLVTSSLGAGGPGSRRRAPRRLILATSRSGPSHPARSPRSRSVAGARASRDPPPHACRERPRRERDDLLAGLRFPPPPRSGPPGRRRPPVTP